jgi:hypothetical protein
MASLITSTEVTREALRILHQKLNFVGSINRQYDDRFARSGAKIGDTLSVRLPNQYTVRSGATLNPTTAASATNEQFVPLQVNNQKGVDVNFTSVERTMKLDDFSQRILEPAMSVLAANIEADALSMALDVAQQVGTANTPPTTLANILAAGVKLDNALTPRDNNRNLLVTPTTQAALVGGLSTIFQDATQLGKQYKDGTMGRAAGFDWYSNTMMPTMTNGTAVFSAGAISVAPTEGGKTLTATCTVSGGTIAKGTVFTIANVFEVHPETKATTNRLMQFVVDSTITASTTNAAITFSPAIFASATDGRRNVNVLPTTNAVTSASGAVSTAYQQNIAYHKDAFCFATADLILPKGVDFAAREIMDGISMRIVQQYNIVDDTLPCRIDVLYGYKTIRPQLACRITE